MERSNVSSEMWMVTMLLGCLCFGFHRQNRTITELAQDWLTDSFSTPPQKILMEGSLMTLIASANRGLVLGVLLLLSCLYEGLVSAALQAQPLLQQSDLVYQGAFRVPGGIFGGSSFEYGGTALAHNPAKNSLFIVGHDWHQQVAEISIPTSVNSTVVGNLPTASVLQPFTEATEGKMFTINPGNIKVGGLLVHQGQLYISAYDYYDGNASTVYSHFSRPLNLSTKGQVGGPFNLGTLNSGFYSGYMASVPQAWQANFGAAAITGNCCLAIISRTSHGPGLFSFDPANLGVIKPAPASPLVYYDSAHTTLGPWNATSKVFNGTTEIQGVVFPDGTRSVLFFGRQGIGTYCYGGSQCNDPAFPNTQGNHAYPYVYQVWAYDAAELAAVKAGSKQPWDVKP
jgi:hypothetical protein